MSSLIFENRGAYLYFRMSGEPVDMAEARALQARTMAEVKAAKLPRILFQKEGSTRALKMEDFYAIAESMGREITGLKTAVLTSQALQTPEVAFFELATSSAGNSLRYFTDFDQAEAWLLAN